MATFSRPRARSDTSWIRCSPGVKELSQDAKARLPLRARSPGQVCAHVATMWRPRMYSKIGRHVCIKLYLRSLGIL